MLVIFDLDNTLIDRSASFRRWAVELVARLGLDPAEERWLTTADGDGFVPRPAFLLAVRERYGLAEPLETMVDRYRERIVTYVEPDPRVPAALDRLRGAGWRVAIATNGDTRQQRAKLRRTGLDAHVDAVAISQEVGVEKPDRLMFETAARRCGARLTGGGWMVGDCPTRDIGGGQAAGLRTIWMRRGRTWSGAAAPPDATADDFVEPITILLNGS